MRSSHKTRASQDLQLAAGTYVCNPSTHTYLALSQPDFSISLSNVGFFLVF